MPLFVIFIVGSVLLGAGSMLAPAWRTSQPRISLSATFALALVMGGAVFWAFLFGWDTLVVDYLLFALVSTVVLGGTLSQAQTRAEAKGETLADQDQGWTGPEDLLFFGLVATLFILTVTVMGVPTTTSGIAWGSQTLALRLSGQFDTLAPFHPEIGLFQPPGLTAISAYLSKQLTSSVAITQFGVGAITAFLCVWLAYDWGSEILNKRLGRSFAMATLVSGGVFLLLTSGQYTTLLATAFAFGLAICAVRIIRHVSPFDAIAGGFFLGAIIYADFALGLIALGVVIVGGLGVIAWDYRRHQTLNLKLVLSWLIVLGVCLLGISPWLAKNIGRSNLLILMTNGTTYGWLILPITAIFGYGIWQAFEQLAPSLRQRLRPFWAVWMIGVFAVAVGALWFITNAQRPIPADDVAVLTWGRKNLPEDAILLNYHANDWAMVLTDRVALAMPILEGYTNSGGAQDQNDLVDLAWSNPERLQTVLDTYGVTHIYKPSGVADLTGADVTVIYEVGDAKLYELNGTSDRP